MPSQRVILGAGLAILLIITAASIGLDLKSRSDAAGVRHMLGVMKKISDLRLLVRRAESSVRGFMLYESPAFREEFRDAHERIAPALAELKQAIRGNPEQSKLLESTASLVLRRVEIAGEALRLTAEGDRAGLETLRARAEGRAAMELVSANFDRIADAEEKLLAVREADSRRTGAILIGIDIAGTILILLLVGLLLRENRRASRELESSLHETKAANEILEAAVAERTEHLVAAHAELSLSVSVLQSTFHGMAEAVLVLDKDGKILLANPAAEQMLRYRRGMNIQDMRAQSGCFHGDGDTPMQPDEMPSSRVLRGEPFDGLEFVLRPASGAPPAHLVVSGRPMRDTSGALTGGALVYHDATAARETERQLHQAQKLDAVGKLTGGVAHDFNNMLTVIAGNTETLVAALKDRPELQRMARLIDDAAERCAELIQHLLAFARKQPLRPHNVEVNAAIADVARLLRPTLGEQIQIECSLGKDVTTAHIDPSRLAHAVINMAINARDAMPDGGKLLLETGNVVLDEAYAEANPEVRPGRYLMLAVSDTGTGMPQAVRDKAFEPFFTTKEAGRGSGLGLSMVYGFVKQSGGHIKIYSEQGHGTTIRLYLPPGRGHGETPAAANDAFGGSETVLVVEDDALVRNFVTAQLQSLGYRTVAVADGRAALNLVERGEPFDLLFTDLIMPGGLSGRELADAIIRHRPDTKVLYTSGYTDNAIAQHGRLREGVLLLTKPYRRNQLAEMIRRALRRDAVHAG
jgi:PAS domain S-box-containing protein